MITDHELLCRHVHEGSEPAFADLVTRHANLVYGTALRQLCGNATLAEEVTQAVFTAMAAKGAGLLRVAHLAGWLHRTTCFTVSHTVRTERRRQAREQAAHTLQTIAAEAAASDLPALPPGLLDTVLARLGRDDREAVLLRFFEERSFAEIGAALATSEDAARMRVTRALEKIRGHFEHHGIRSAVAAVLAGQAAAAPAGLAAALAPAAITGAAAVAVTAAPAVTLTFMLTTKSLAWLAGATAALALGVAVYERQAAQTRLADAVQARAERDALQAALEKNEQRLRELGRQAGDAERQADELRRELRETAARVPPSAPVAAAPRPASAPAAAADQRARDADRMRRMKPRLLAGQPIKGALILAGRDGKPVDRPVAFVIGQTTTVDAGDAIYLIDPTLNEDGSVAYEIEIRRKGPDGAPAELISGPKVVSTPWDGFTLSISDGQQPLAFAFDPDAPDDPR